MTSTPALTPAPARAAHLGLGSFFRAHQAWYTHRSRDRDEWGITAFAGHRSTQVVQALRAQQGRYTLLTRGPQGDEFTVVSSVVGAATTTEHGTWLASLASPHLAVLTLTITEAGYPRRPDGRPDLDLPAVQADRDTLRADPAALVRTAPGRIVAGLLARRRADAGPLTLVPCDNLPDNGGVLQRLVHEFGAAVDPTLTGWLDAQVTVASTMVDRITPRTTPADLDAVHLGTGWADQAPVVTEPFSEWVVSGRFPAGRPAWESAGATFAEDVAPYEERKLWLLNGAHSLLAYTGLALGHHTVAEAVADERCRAWLSEWWQLCTPHLNTDAQQAHHYTQALLTRFANPRMAHSLTQIATDGSQKLAVRLIPVLREELRAGRLPEVAVTVLAAWVQALRDQDERLADVRMEDLQARAQGREQDAVPALLEVLDPALSGYGQLLTDVQKQLRIKDVHR